MCIGGGTGLSTLLRGLKKYAQVGPSRRVEITAIVTVTDDGGSSGRLRREFDVLPPGDIRNCLVALSEDEALLSRLFQYRFSAGNGLRGHSFGNLFLTALTDLTGDFAHAVELSADVLAIAGRIFPSTSQNVALEAVLKSGRVLRGESKISKSKSPIVRVSIVPKNCKPLPDALEAIERADLITFGPGSLFTSVIPNLLIRGMTDAIHASRAAKAYYVNLMWQPGETIAFRASDHVEAIYRHSKHRFLNYAVVNTEKVPSRILKRYAEANSYPVEVDTQRLQDLGLSLVGGALVGDQIKVRHDPEASAGIALKLAERARKLKSWNVETAISR